MKATTKLDEDFPALSSLPKSNAPQSQQASTPAQQQSKQQSETKQFTLDEQMFHDISPEQIALTDMTTQDFGFALSSSLNYIPDTPYEKDPSIEDSNSDTPYPKATYMRLLQPEFFKKYDNETLFFIFFYFPGTSQQYFAGKELRRRGWVFIPHFASWFRLIGEPSESTPEYIVGKFEYFDHGNKEWTIRQKNNCKLETSMLEQDF